MKISIPISVTFFVNNVLSLKGDATYYDVGLGSCGKTNSNSQLVVALSSDIMEGYKSKYCDKLIDIKHGKKSVTVKVVDTCPSCDKGDVDLSPTAFKKLAKLNKGRIDITWDFK